MVASRNNTNGSPSSNENTEVDAKIKVEVTANELDKFKFHLNSLAPKDQTELLDQLRLHQELQMSRTEKKTDDKDLDKDDTIKRQLWEEYNANKNKESEAKKLDRDTEAYVHITNAQSLNGNIPSGRMSSGFEITLASRDTREIGRTRVILHKNDRGKDAIQRKKTRDKVVQALKPEISAGNISRILTSTNADEYDIANEAISSQAILNSIHCYCIQYDMETLLKIPVNVDLMKPLLVKNATKFLNAIEDWQQLKDKKYFEWQEFIVRYGTTNELESNSWLEDTLLLSMDKNLRYEIKSDMSGFPKNKQGAITMLCCIIKRMVVKNQEAKDALESYIKEFDITKFPGENVSSACLWLKAVAKALGNKDLPSNVICKILEGFAKSSTKAFNDVCSSQIAMRRASFYKSGMKNTSLQNQLVDS